MARFQARTIKENQCLVPGGKDGKEKDIIVDWMREGEYALATAEEMLDMLPGDRVKANEIMDYILRKSTKVYTLATLPISVYTASMPDEDADSYKNVFHKLNVDIRRASKCLFTKFYLPCEPGQRHTMFRIKSVMARRIDIQRIR